MQPVCAATSTKLLYSRLSISPIHYSALLHVPSSIHQKRSNHNLPPNNIQGASARLFADAQREEAEETAAAETSKTTRVSILEQEHENWTGDENIKDAVLRMLMDKYKPLRTGTIQSAEQKLKQSPLKLKASFVGLSDAESKPQLVPLEPSGGSWANEPLLPSSAGHQPWHTTFKAPSHEVSSIKFAQLPPQVSSKPSSTVPLDDRARRLEKEARKRTQQVGRLTQAKESTLDYRMGIKGSRSPVNRPNPVSVKGWTSLVEDRIEKARKAGMFSVVKGRGQPIVRSMGEYNPFIAREEFLMNRIVQRNGAAPPWVEVQGELDAAVDTFRGILRQSWIRRAIRMLAMDHSPRTLQRLTLQDIKAFRDPEWVQRERSYHDVIVANLNSLVRKYNGLAPYAVRRPYYLLEAETERLYEDCAGEILRLIAERAHEASPPPRIPGEGQTGTRPTGPHQEALAEQLSFLRWLRHVLRRWFTLEK